jgi:isocitrate dehydrogenase
MWKSPNGTIRNILGGVIFREPIICKNVPRLVPGWTSRSSSAATPSATSTAPPTSCVPGPGKLTMKFVGDDGKVIENEVFDFPARRRHGHVQPRRFDPRFRPRLLNYGLNRGWPVYLSTKNTILKAYDGRFKDLFQEVFDAEFADKFKAAGITYEHRLIDDMVASALKWSRRLRLGLQELRRRRAVRHRGAGLRLAGPDDLGADDARWQDRRGRGRARHRDPPLPRAPEGQGDLDQPDRLDLRLDAGPRLSRQVRRHAGRDRFAETLEKVCIETVEAAR